MAQIKKALQEATIPLTKMAYTPDVPSSALGPNEYNYGINVEADVRGLRSTSGDQQILPAVTGTPFYITAGFRQGNQYYFIIATTEGKWWMSNGGAWTDITPTVPPFIDTEYAPESNVTEAWNGTVPIFNDGINPPFFLPDEPNATLTMYKSNIPPKSISNIAFVNATTQQITVSAAYDTAPFVAGDKILIKDVNNYYNGIYTVVSSTTTTIDYLAVPGAAYPGGAVGTVSAAYTWNYNPNWRDLTAGFIRMYSTPNVGNILVAGNLTATVDTAVVADTSTGNNVVLTVNAANNMENCVITGPGIPASTTVTSVVPGVSLTLNNTATATATGVTLTVQVPTNFPVTVSWSQAFGLNEAPLTWEPSIINIANQLEVPTRGQVVDAYPSNGQLFIASYWDTVVFTPMNYTTTSAPILGVRLFNQGRGLLNANCWANTDELVYGVDARDFWVFDGRTYTGLGNQRVKNWFFDQIEPSDYDMIYLEVNTQKNQVEVYYPDSDATIVDGKRIANKMLSYRYDLQVWNAPRDVDTATFACESPVWSEPTPGTWIYNDASRTMVYAQGIEDSELIQKDQGLTFINSAPIVSEFKKDNIKLVQDYSTKTMVHRILPEVVNLNAANIEIDPVTESSLIGNVKIQVDGANSVGQAPVSTTSFAVATNTDNPWAQINQNSHRVNSLEITSDSSTPGTIWMCNAVTWQFTEVEDDR